MVFLFFCFFFVFFFVSFILKFLFMETNLFFSVFFSDFGRTHKYVIPITAVFFFLLFDLILPPLGQHRPPSIHLAKKSRPTIPVDRVP